MKKRLFLLISMIMLSISTYAWKFTRVEVVQNGKSAGIYNTSMNVSVYTSPNRVVVNNTWTYYIKTMKQIDENTMSMKCVNNTGRPYIVLVTTYRDYIVSVVIAYDDKNYQVYSSIK